MKDTSATDPVARIGLIGLGSMGVPVAARLIAAGHAVSGYDLEEGRLAAFEDVGGTPSGSTASIARSARVILTLLPSEVALSEVCEELVAAVRAADIDEPPDVVELSTLGLAAKSAARDRLAAADITMLDCALSGTALQAALGDVVVYASGDSQALERCRPVLQGIGRAVHEVGEFGSAARTKLVSNLLIAVHIAAAAEALLLARRCGLDPGETLAAVADGAGTSRMLEVRGPLMVAAEFEPPSMRLELFMKDIDLIEAMSHAVGAPTPLFDAAADIYRASVARGRGGQDTAAVFAVLLEQHRADS